MSLTSNLPMSIRGDGDAVNTYRTKLRRSSSEPFCSFRSEAGIHFPIERFTAKAFEACPHKDELSISKLAAVRFQVRSANATSARPVVSSTATSSPPAMCD